ncbi:hypothetical protein G5B38_02470 [Pseudohalocynthiibacter aestuariivivens]|nr:hypothetical protein [Pseudohalocynthiibacter aestuariivivens]QIE44483.1 hypothetical protein G5B38_02470 [Pseudohalocynthiibacter aestuariivivens]
MDKPTLLIVSVGELGTNVLEAAARSGLFSRIVIAGRNAAKARARANGALIGAGLEGHYPTIVGEQLDVDNPSFVKDIKAINPDFVFTTATLMPWWQVDQSSAPKLPFGGYVSLHLAVMKTFRDRLAEADLDAIWIGASYPDVVNPILCRTGFGPLCGIGNVQEPIPKLLSGLSNRLQVPTDEISVRLVAQHAFEYPVLSDGASADLPPYLLHAEANGNDVTELAREILLEPFPFTFDLFFNRVTASAAIQAFDSFVIPEATAVHLPAPNGLVGGYPVTVQNNEIKLDLHPAWSEADAIDTNLRSLPCEGIEAIEADGTVTFTEVTQAAFAKLVGKPIERVTIHTAAEQAQEILKAL